MAKELPRPSSLERLQNPKIYFEPAWKSTEYNIKHCSKSRDFEEFGEQPNDSERIASKFKQLVDTQGVRGVTTFSEQYPSTWFLHGQTMLSAWVIAHQETERPEIKVSWYHGPPGTGKSAWANYILPMAYKKDPCTKWWHGYRFEKTCIIDELAPGYIDINHLLG